MMKLQSRYVTIKLGEYNFAIPCSIADLVKWVAIDADGYICGYDTEPWIVHDGTMWGCTDSFWFLGKAELEGEDWKGLKWQI